MLNLFDSLDFVSRASGQFSMLMEAALDKNAFHDRQELKEYLMEGSLLNLSKLGEHYFSIPSGQYMVYTTNNGSTMLIPLNERGVVDDVYEHKMPTYEIDTPKLLNNWNLLGKPSPIFEEDEDLDEYNRIDTDTVDRDAIVSAMKDQNLSVTDLANKVGVDKSTISRYLRKPKEGIQGDPGGRTPSLVSAGEISKVLRASPVTLFPDVFKKKSRRKKRQGNRASGVTSVTKNIKGRSATDE